MYKKVVHGDSPVSEFAISFVGNTALTPSSRTESQVIKKIPINQIVSQRVFLREQGGIRTSDTFYKPIAPSMTNLSLEADLFSAWEKKREEFYRFINRGSRRNRKKQSPTCFQDIGGRKVEVVNWTTNDYLGFGINQKVQASGMAAQYLLTAGALGSRALGGTTEFHIILEKELTEYKAKGNSDEMGTILFSSGSDANKAVTGLIKDRKGMLVLDSKAHQSLIDGSRLAQVETKFFPHNELDKLEELLSQTRQKNGWGDFKIMVAVDGIYSMDGDLAKLVELRELAIKYGAVIILDDAHATGTIGQTGSGTLEYFDISDWQDHFIVVGTLGKALGTMGGFVTARQDLIAALKLTSHQLIYTTSLPPGIVASSIQALRILRENSSIVYRLQERAARFKAGTLALGVGKNTATHIAPLIVGKGRRIDKQSGDERVRTLYERLLDRGHLTAPIPYPAVPHGHQILRVQVTAAHTAKDVDSLLDAIAEVKKMHGQEIWPSE